MFKQLREDWPILWPQTKFIIILAAMSALMAIVSVASAVVVFFL